LSVSGEARELMERLGSVSLHLSIAHTSEHAVAQVLIEKA
jgi:phosphopantetheinyl transferase (holo-ACP synthase)